MIELKNSHPLFCYLDEDQTQLVNQIRDIHAFQKGEMIIKAGDRSRDLICIDSGKVEVFTLFENGTENSIAILEAGSLIGEMNFVISTHRTANVRALEHVQVSSYPYLEFTQLLLQKPDLAAGIFAAINRQLASKLQNFVK